MEILNVKTSVDIYPDQTNVTVTIETDSDNVWRVQTDSRGYISEGCKIYFNDNYDNDIDLSEYKEFEIVITKATEVATEWHKINS